jgi:hypothetical protein
MTTLASLHTAPVLLVAMLRKVFNFTHQEFRKNVSKALKIVTKHKLVIQEKHVTIALQ